MVVPWLSSLLITGKSTTQVFASVNGPSMSKFCKEQPPVAVKITATQSKISIRNPNFIAQNGCVNGVDPSIYVIAMGNTMMN